MKFASYLLQSLYGGKEAEQAEQADWQKIANQRLQTINYGYHPGRFINCIEIAMHAYKALLTTQGSLMSAATPLPMLPPHIPDYLEHLHERMLNLDESKKAKFYFRAKLAYQEIVDFIVPHQLPLYSHLILFADLKKLPGGHVFSGIILPDQSAIGFKLYFYDAQGFIPESWFSVEQFDEFYSVSHFYVHDSDASQQAIKAFINSCQLAVDKPELQGSGDKSINELGIAKLRLLEFIRLELFRLEAKVNVTVVSSTIAVQDKIKEYNSIYEELHEDKGEYGSYLSFARLFIKTAAAVKNHSYSYNWFDPQSLVHFRSYFEKLFLPVSLEAGAEQPVLTVSIANYLLNEITRLAMLNELSNSAIETKITAYFEQLEALLTRDVSLADLKSRLQKIKDISGMTRHWLSFPFAAASSAQFNTHLQPLESYLEQESGQLKLQ